MPDTIVSAVLKRQQHRCQACESAAATTVHRIAHSTIFDPLYEFVAICEDCKENLIWTPGHE